MVDAGAARPRLVADGDEDTWAAAIRDGDQHAFEMVFRRHHASLCDVAAIYAPSRAVAEEVVADVFLALWRRRAEWDSSGGVAGYLYRAVRNAALNSARGARRERARYALASVQGEVPGMASGSGAAAGEGVDEVSRVAAVRRAIAALPPNRRVVLTLRWRDGLGFAEIAERLGTTAAAVQMQLSRALGALRAAMPRDLR